MYFFRLLALVHLVFFTYFPTLASVVQPGDGPYFQNRRNQTLYIYDPNSREFIESLAAIHQGFRLHYDQSFAWSLDEEQALILTSANQQVANALAMTHPSIKTIWYPSGAEKLEEMASSSWLMTLVSHETAHLYQFNAKGSINAKLKRFFGQADQVDLLPIPIFLEPNLWTPTSLLEGNAVFNESRVNLGGRLHSGEKRALVLAQMSAGLLDATRLINDEFKFPFGESAYLHGGYFQAHLAAKYGVDKTNQFFKAQGHHIFFPLILNDTFREHFGNSFYFEVHEHVHEMQAMAAKQKFSGSDPIAKNVFFSPLNHDDRSIWWLSTDGHTLPALQIFDRSSMTFKSRTLDIPMGKVFFQNNLPFASASLPINLHQISYSLFSEDAIPNHQYDSQIVTDQRAGHTVSLDAKDSWLDPHLLLDGQPYDIAHSNPVLDRAGHVYYFRQNGAQRLIYRDREPLTKYDGYYGKLTEITPDGSIYFIGNTDYGSSLFRYKDREFWRVLSSDRVIDARWIEGRKFLTVEVGPEGHSVHISESQPLSQAPSVFSYAFPMTSVPIPPALSSTETSKTEQSYSSITETRLNSLETEMRLGATNKLGYLLRGNFTDPLEYHLLKLEHGDSGTQSWSQFSYSFTKYLPQFFVDFTWRNGNLWHYDNQQETSLGMRLPILKTARWDSILSLNSFLTPRERFAAEASFYLNHNQPTLIGFFPWSEFELRIRHRFDELKNSERTHLNRTQIATHYRHALPDHYYLTGDLGVFYSNFASFPVTSTPMSTPPNIELHRLTFAPTRYINLAGTLRLELHKDLRWSEYSPRYPLAVNRLILVGIAQVIEAAQVLDDEGRNNIQEVAWGLDTEILLAHKLPLRMRLLFNAFDLQNPVKPDSQMALNLRHEF